MSASAKKNTKSKMSAKKSMKGGTSASLQMMNTSGLLDPSHNIYTTNATSSSSLLQVPAPFSTHMNAYNTSLANASSSSVYVPSYGASGGASRKQKAKAKANANAKAKDRTPRGNKKATK